MTQTNYKVFLFYKVFFIITFKKSKPGLGFMVHTYFQSYFLAVDEHCTRVERASGVCLVRKTSFRFLCLHETWMRNSAVISRFTA